MLGGFRLFFQWKSWILKHPSLQPSSPHSSSQIWGPTCSLQPRCMAMACLAHNTGRSYLPLWTTTRMCMSKWNRRKHSWPLRLKMSTSKMKVSITPRSSVLNSASNNFAILGANRWMILTTAAFYLLWQIQHFCHWFDPSATNQEAALVGPSLAHCLLTQWISSALAVLENTAGAGWWTAI